MDSRLFSKKESKQGIQESFPSPSSFTGGLRATIPLMCLGKSRIGFDLDEAVHHTKSVFVFYSRPLYLKQFICK
jgi:hypothetical protein